MYYRYEEGDIQLQNQLQHEISPSSINSDITPSIPSPLFVPPPSSITMVTRQENNEVSSSLQVMTYHLLSKYCL